MRITARAYGKLNLSLEITGRLTNGYHTIRSVMQSVSLYNRLTVSANQSGAVTLSSDDRTLPTDQRNTACRAAALILGEPELPKGAGLDIFIEKRVPYQAGMGSASADAAGVLKAANELFGGAVSEKRLLELAAMVGADVPFCLTGGTALAEGIGDRLTALPDLPECGFLIFHPNKGMSTPEAYRRFDALTAPAQPDSLKCAEAIKAGSIKDIAARCGNVFEQCCDIGGVFEIKEALYKAGALSACMTGSGTAVFGLFGDLEAARRAGLSIEGTGRRGWTAVPVKRGVEIE